MFFSLSSSVYFQRSIRLYLDLNFDHAEYKIYVYTKSFFYTSLGAGRLEFLPIKKGQYVKVNLALQVQIPSWQVWIWKLIQPFENTFSNLKTFQLLESLFIRCLRAPKTVRMIQIMIETRSKRNSVLVDDTFTFFQAYSKLLHAEFNREFGCTLPSYGGLKISDEEGHMLCLNASIYNNTRMYKVASICKEIACVVFIL